MSELREWLRRHNLEHYADALEANDIGMDILPELSERDLEQLGLSLGNRRRLLKAVAGRAAEAASPQQESPVQAAGEAERRQVTVLFCDMVGSTALACRPPGYGQVVAKEAMDIGIERAKKHGVCVVGLVNAHHIGRIGHWAEQCARAGLVSTHWVNVHGPKSLVAPFGGVEPRFTTNPYCTAIPRKGKEPIVLDFATSQVAMGKVRVANNKRVQMDPGLLIDAAGQPTTEPGVMYNPPFGAILPFGLHKGGGLAVICDLLAGALTGGRTHSPRTIKKDGHDIINNMLSVIIDPAAMGSTELFEDEVETFINWVKSARPQAGVAEVLAPGEPERARRADREKNGVPIDTTTWQQLIEVARKVRLNDTEIPLATAAA
jgi:uncharacterized oxidoreductase